MFASKFLPTNLAIKFLLETGYDFMHYRNKNKINRKIYSLEFLFEMHY